MSIGGSDRGEAPLGDGARSANREDTLPASRDDTLPASREETLPASRDQTLPLGDRPGTYVLVLRLARAARVRVGALGPQRLEAGWYLYVGSAFGPGGVRGRLRHHLRSPRRPRWHVDHLRRAADLCEVWFTHDPAGREHEWAERLHGAPGIDTPVPGFGASDCGCPTHLFHLDERPGAVRAGDLLAVAAPASLRWLDVRHLDPDSLDPGRGQR